MDGDIIKTDMFLDDKRPKQLEGQGISRDHNIYAYLYLNNQLIDIRTGNGIPLQDFISNSNQAVLKLEIDPQRCYVSDLDTYDSLKKAIEDGDNNAKLEQLAKSYWDKLIPLEEYRPHDILRPEIMITYDILPAQISRCS